MGPACPDPEMLRSLLLGLITGPPGDELESHLERCTVCLDVARTLQARDALLVAAGPALTPAAAVAAEEQPVVEQLLRRARSLFAADLSPHGSAHELDEWLPRIVRPFAPGELGRLGPYRLLGLLGAGGMGIVLRAEDERLGRPVAVKVMRPRLAERPDARDRFLREARALAAVSHDHVIPVYEVGEAGGVPYLVMPLLRGMTLADWLSRNTPPPVAVVVRWGRQLAEGLAAAHARGLVHRDVKPGNVWLESELRPAADGTREQTAALPDRVKLLDFGLVRSERDGGTVTQEGLLLGTPDYLSPEQAKAEPVDARSDLFSLGCVLYELCTGAPPFRGPTVLATLSSLAADTPRRLHDHRPDVPPGLDDLVLRLLAKRPADRPATAVEVAGRLRELETDNPYGHSRGRRARRAVLGGLLITGAGMAAAGLLGWSFVPMARDGPTGTMGITPASGSPTPSPGRLAGHTGAVNALVFLPGSRTLLSGSADGTIRRWDAVEGREAGTRLKLPKGCTGLALTNDGRTLAACGSDGTLRLYDAASGEPTLSLSYPDPVWGVAFDRTGGFLYAATDNGVACWVILTRACVTRFVAGGRSVRWVGVSPDGEWLAAGSAGKELWFRNLKESYSRQQYAAHRGLVRAGAFSPDRTRLATVGPPDDTVRLWDMATRAVAAAYPLHPAGATAVAWSPRGRLVASGGGNGAVLVWEARTGQVVGEFRAHAPAADGVSVTSLAFASNGRTLASGGADGLVALWDVSSLAKPAPAMPAD